MEVIALLRLLEHLKHMPWAAAVVYELIFRQLSHSSEEKIKRDY